ncbi:MAG TPA: UDP-N-acetylmuramoyl-tripeptide--D-alanyl-D-alanine ligase [Candidatus Paceibacterota bacterium]|nr:UDP-N-acetylmuramoyl-tripeptide--D-alanyl-D-alanine ligase [Candidatus Paceibacterota bacterium]
MDSKTLYNTICKAPFSISTDTRTLQEGQCFFCLRGETFDGNTFAEAALEKGAQLVVVDNPAAVLSEKCMLVENTLKALQELAQIHRSHFSIPVIAIGGSNGKTTTKELVAAVLGTEKKVHVTKGNLNNEIGVPLTLLALQPEAEIAIIEVGANHSGEHTKLMEIVSPTHILVTNNGADHLEGFGSLAGVRAANKELFDWARTHSAHAFVNKALPDLVADSAGSSRMLYPTAPYKSTSHMLASLEYKGTPIHSNLFGSFNEANILAALAIGEHFAISLENMQKAITTYQPTLHRSQIYKGENYVAVLDYYNANPTSMQLALTDFIQSTPAGKRILILGDMLELGTAEQAAHEGVLSFIKTAADPKDTIFCIGPRFKQYAPQYPFHFFETATKARPEFNIIELAGTYLFAKGSRGIKVEEVIEEKILF